MSHNCHTIVHDFPLFLFLQSVRQAFMVQIVPMCAPVTWSGLSAVTLSMALVTVVRDGRGTTVTRI